MDAQGSRAPHLQHLGLDAQSDAASADAHHETTVGGAQSWLARVGSVAVRYLGGDILIWVARVWVDARLSMQSFMGQPSVHDVATSELRQTLRVLLAVHGFQLFFCPFFNADPHPGNILLLPDGRVGLIDFGQCGRLSRAERIGLARLFVALGDDGGDAVTNERVAGAFSATGIRTAESDEDFLALMPRLMFDKLRPEWLDRTKEGPLRTVLRKDKIEDFPLHLALAYRTSMLLRGLCLVLQENVSIADEWRPLAESWLQENRVLVDVET